jgi:hypothetical protein
MSASIEDVAEQGAAGERMQHLGPLGLHPGALAGGEDDDVERGAGHGR